MKNLSIIKKNLSLIMKNLSLRTKNTYVAYRMILIGYSEEQLDHGSGIKRWLLVGVPGKCGVDWPWEKADTCSCGGNWSEDSFSVYSLILVKWNYTFYKTFYLLSLSLEILPNKNEYVNTNHTSLEGSNWRWTFARTFERRNW